VIQFSLLCYHSWGFVTYKVLDNHVHINFLEIMSAVLTVGFIIDLVIQLNVANPMVRSTPRAATIYEHAYDVLCLSMFCVFVVVRTAADVRRQLRIYPAHTTCTAHYHT